MSALSRLMAKRDVVGDCWIFAGARTANGYGSIWDGERTQYAHRLAYELHIGPIPNGLDLDHLCRTRACFNPAHLEPVSRLSNLWRSPLTWVVNASKTHCPQRHEYTPENTYHVRRPRKDGSISEARACVTCRRDRYHARKAAA